MSIEINRNAEYTYRIAPHDDTVIERRLNQHGARWGFYKKCDSRQDAKAALFRIANGKEGRTR